MATSTVIPQLVPTADRISALAAALLSWAEADAAELVTAFDGNEAVRELLVTVRDTFASNGAQATADAAAEELVAANGDIAPLRTRLNGRDPEEELLSLHLGLGFAENALTQLLDWRIDLGDIDADRAERLREVLTLTSAHESLIVALTTLFADDDTLDDRLAMWGRRVAGDAAVWARTLLGLDLDERADEAESMVVGYLSSCFAEHSRRMNALKLAA